MDKELTAGDVRSVAFGLLSQRPEGIRQTDLFKAVEKVLREEYRIESEHLIKNSLWNLEKTHPEFVEKERISSRQVVVKPTKALIELRNDIVHGDYDKKEVPEADQKVKDYFKILTMMLRKAESDNIEIEKFLYMTPKDVLFEMSEQERSAVYMLKRAFFDISRYGEEIERSKRLWG